LTPLYAFARLAASAFACREGLLKLAEVLEVAPLHELEVGEVTEAVGRPSLPSAKLVYVDRDTDKGTKHVCVDNSTLD
jgi:hypothetical protein